MLGRRSQGAKLRALAPLHGRLSARPSSPCVSAAVWQLVNNIEDAGYLRAAIESVSYKRVKGR